jgi:hypothetical protein
MKLAEQYDKFLIGFISGTLLPVMTGFIIFIFSPGHLSLSSYINRIVESNIVTHSVSICVFSNIIIFLLFNRFDMLRASRGVLAVTIVWAVIVFGVKILG